MHQAYLLIIIPNIPYSSTGNITVGWMDRYDMSGVRVKVATGNVSGVPDYYRLWWVLGNVSGVLLSGQLWWVVLLVIQ